MVWDSVGGFGDIPDTAFELDVSSSLSDVFDRFFA
jgi:hypothetical protein